jgi:hypothetical protein
MMDDYISRQAAIDELNGQIEYCDKALRAFDIAVNDAYAVKVERASLIAYKEQLEALPAADVVPVVRCKDCIHNNDCDIQYSAQAGENFFCGFGETEKDVREDVYG